jgi:hypothetical protein
MQEKINYKIYLSYFILVIIYILFSLQHSPLFETLGYDKEVFQYIGMIIKNDLHPYSDVFDHKPPVIYLLNYLGVLLTPNSTWGIFLIMNVTGMFSSLLIYKLAYKKLNNIVLSILIAILFIGLINNNVFIEGGNLTRQFATYLNTAILFIVFGSKKSKLKQALVGVLIGVIFFTQQNEILSGSILTIYYLICKENFNLFSLKKMLTNILCFIIGLLVPALGILLIINHWNNFDEFMNQVFLFNFDTYISNKSFIEKIRHIVNRLYSILISYKTLLVIVLLTITNLSVNRIKRVKYKIDGKLVVIAISFIFQILSTSISGESYGHYFLMFIPYVICAFIYSYNPKNHKYINYVSYALLGTLILKSLTSMSYQKPNDKLMELVVKHVDSVKNTPGQFYSVNPRYLRVNFNLNIIAPSKFVYTHFDEKEHYKELITDFRKNETKYILYTPKKSTFTKELTSFLTLNYTEVLKHNDYTLYKKNN